MSKYFLAISTSKRLLIVFSEIESVSSFSVIIFLGSYKKSFPCLASSAVKFSHSQNASGSPSNIARTIWISFQVHYVKSVQIRSFLWSKYGKIRTRNNFVFGHIFTQWPSPLVGWLLATFLFGSKNLAISIAINKSVINLVYGINN